MNDTLREIKSNIKDQSELEYFLIHQNRYAYILHKISDLKLPPGGKILDAGCYPPHLFRTLKSEGYDVYGISSKHEPIKLPNTVSLNIETDPLPYPENTFDAIIFTEIIEHLTINPNVYLQKLKKVLKPSGVIILTTINATNLKNRTLMMLGKSPSFSLGQLYETNTGDDSIYYRHNREFTLPELKEILIKEDFKLIELSYFSAYSPLREKLKPENPISLLFKIPGYALTQLFPPLKDSLVALATK